MTSQENSTGYAVCSAVARRFGGLPSAARPVQSKPLFPFGFAPSGAMRGALAQTGPVSAGAEGLSRGFRSAGAGIRENAPRKGIGEFTGNMGGYSALIGEICRKIRIVAGKRLQFSGGWGKRKQRRDSLSKEVTQMSGNQQGRCEMRHAGVNAGFEEVDATNGAFCGTITGGSPHELKLKREFSRGE